MIFWLLLGLLLLPSLFALLARRFAVRGNPRGAALIAGAGFAGAIACALAIVRLPLESSSLGALRAFVPSSEIVVARESFLELDDATAAGGVPDAGEGLGGSAQPSAAPAAPPTPEPSVTAKPTATVAPTPTPEPTSEPTPEPTSEPTPEPTSEPEPTAEPEAEPEEPESRSEPERYVVEPGDTLRGIAALYDVDAGELQRYNGLSDEEADSLEIGQVLFIPPTE